MRFAARRVSLTVVGVFALVGALQAQPPDAPQPLAVVAARGLDDFHADRNALAALAALPGVPPQVERLLDLRDAAKGIPGLDPARPWGVVLSGEADSDRFGIYAFAPARDGRQFLVTLRGLLSDVKDFGDGVYEVKTSEGTVYVRYPGGAWLFVSDRPASLSNLPDDPTPLLEGLHEPYDVALRVYPSRATAEQRAKVVDWIGDRRDWWTADWPYEGPRVHEWRQDLGRRALDALPDALSQTESVTLGLSADPDSGTLLAEATVAAAPGSELAARLKEVAARRPLERLVTRGIDELRPRRPDLADRLLKAVALPSGAESDGNEPAQRLAISLEAVAQALVEAGPPELGDKAARGMQILQSQPGGDNATVVLAPLDNAMQLRLELQRDALRLLGRLRSLQD